ncbi:MAG: hypothetical protein LBQ42_13675 [Synergistaceae bacterium]|jgi:hypothetical protein|nr:hypothetical protein [Synergistaceae bacterium]
MAQHDQWLRDISLIVGRAGGEGVELSGLKIAFDVLKTDTETPNKAQVKIWNLADDTAQKIKDEFDTVILNAGYKAKMGLIYKGNIIQVRRLRERVVDKILEITMGDGDEGYIYSMTNKTLAAGATQKDILDAALEPMKEFGIELGYCPDLGDEKLPRGKTVFRASRDVIADICKTTGTTWSIQDGRIDIVPRKEAIPGQAFLISPSTGMIDSPKQTNKGIQVRCLLNSEIHIASTIKIEGDIEEASQGGGKGKHKEKKSEPPAKLASDGIYRVIQCRYKGDTWGNVWECEIIGVAMDDTSGTATDIKK